MAKVGWRWKSLQKYINQIDLKINVMLSKNEMPLILWQPDHISWILSVTAEAKERAGDFIPLGIFIKLMK